MAATLNRAKVAAFIRKQLHWKHKLDEAKYPKGNRHHYGKQELKELLDFLFGGPPKSKDEEL